MRRLLKFRKKLVMTLFKTLILFKSLKLLSALNLSNSQIETESPSQNPLNLPTEDILSRRNGNFSQAQLLEKLEQVFGHNFLKTYYPSSSKQRKADSSSSEEFLIVDDEYMDESVEQTTSKTPQISLLPDDKVTKYPIIIPSDMDIVTELGDNVISAENSTNFYHSTEEHNSSKDFKSSKTRGRISTSAHFRRNCGDKEVCESRPSYVNYVRNPHYCRCDKGTCDQFGDCCWGIAKTLLYRNPWKCHRVQHENTWSLMISKCSEEFKFSPSSADRIIIKSCENPLGLPSSFPYTYLHDLPVFSNTTNFLYRNIFCARCNRLRDHHDIMSMHTFLRCSKQFNETEKQDFISRAKYRRGKRIWTLENEVGSENISVACGIFTPQLDPRLLSLTIPDIRYCRKNVVDKCPKDFALKDPQTAALCNSYTQIVESRVGFLFKNPHCAQCYGLDAKWDLRCLKEVGPKPPSDTSRITPGAAGARLDSTGLSLLFDFDLDGSGGNYVGYESKCPGELEIWDFLRQKCTMTLCSKDYELNQVDGVCKPIQDLIVATNSTTNENNANSTEIVSDTSSDNSTQMESCYILILHESEYTLLANKSILVLVNYTGSSIPMIFHPDEYTIWNESSISICARELSSSFRQRFSPVLNYMSLCALGLSVFFSLIHILIFFILPKMRNLPGKNLFCLTLSLLISQFLFLSFITAKIHEICVAAAIAIHYFFLASFFWMNVMSFDIWRTFSSQFVIRHSSSGDGGLFLKYCIYGWFTPFVIVSASVLIDILFATNLDLDSPTLRRIRPLYGHNNLCWIGQGLALFLFFALPALILILLNISLFTCTAKAILEQSKDAQRIFKGDPKRTGIQQCSRKNSSSEAEVQRMKLYMKLGVIMGVTWILGILSGLSEWEWLWYPFVLVNGLQGTFIFFGFDAKPKVWKMLKEKFNMADEAEARLKDGRSRSNDANTATNIAGWRRDTTTSTSGGISVGMSTRGESISISHKIPF